MTIISSTKSSEEARRGEIWKVNFEPTIGSEIKKKRPAIVLSINGLTYLPVRLVVPLTEWNKKHIDNPWCIPIEPSIKNGLQKKSAADVLQMRCVSTERLIEQTGNVSAEIMEDIAAALVMVTGYA